MLVSVIIPVYNGEAFLADAVASIRSQSYEPMEIIVVDDGSTDGTAAVARQLAGAVQYICQPNSGPPAARNRGLKTARGDVIAFLDVDDLWSENKLEIQLERLARTPPADLVLGHIQLMMLNGRVDGRPVFVPWEEPKLALSVGAALIRRSVFDRVGLFDESLRYCDDCDWFMRARECGVSLQIHKDVTQYYRRHENNITNQQSIGNRYTIEALKRSIDRRRHQNADRAASQPSWSTFFDSYSEEQRIAHVMPRPLVSVVIPVYNGERYLAAAVDSVLAQTYRPIEVVVLDDGSTDRTASIAASYGSPVRYHFQTNRGLAAAENSGVDVSNGKFIAFIDADDLWTPDKLTRQMAAFEDADEPLDMVFGYVEQFVSPELDEQQKSRLDGDGAVLPGYSTGTMVIRREAFFRAGYFDSDWKLGEFVDWYLKAQEKGLQGRLIPQVVMKRRLHSDNMGTRDRHHQKDYVHILKAALDRRRAFQTREIPGPA